MAEIHSTDTMHDNGHDHDHDHHGNFWTTYIFTTDHKMIAKQFLISGIFWALLGGTLSVIFRLQLGFPEMDMSWLKPFSWWVD